MIGILKKILYSLLVVSLISAVYSFVTSGQTSSLLRYLVKPQFDPYFASVSAVIAFLALIGLFFTRDRETFHYLIEAYATQVRELRAQGKSDPEIADMILKTVGSRPGSRHFTARKKLIEYLAVFK